MFLTSETPSGNWWASLDLSNDSSRTWSVLFVNGLFMGWAVLVVLLRVFTKCFMATRLFVDDCKPSHIPSSRSRPRAQMLTDLVQS